MKLENHGKGKVRNDLAVASFSVPATTAAAGADTLFFSPATIAEERPPAMLFAPAITPLFEAPACVGEEILKQSWYFKLLGGGGTGNLVFVAYKNARVRCSSKHDVLKTRAHHAFGPFDSVKFACQNSRVAAVE